MFFNGLLGLFSEDIGVDLGTANTLIHVKGRGIVLCEPSVVAIHKSTKTILAIGEEAKRMLGKTPADIVAIKPLRDGVIADFEVTERMIHYFITRAQNNRRSLVRPRIVIGVPSGITDVEKRAVKEAAEQAGARKVYIIEEPMAAAIGANLQIHEPAGNMILDIGGGTTEVAVISLGGMVVSKTIRIAGDEMDESLVQYIKRVHNLLIGERTAEEIKIKIGSAYSEDDSTESIEVKGRDTISGLPKTLRISAKEVAEALKGPINAIIQVVKDVLEKTPPALISDIVDRGIVMVGGGALLRGLEKLLSKETQLPVVLADDPFRCVALGTGKYLEELKNIERARRGGRIGWRNFYLRERDSI